MSLEEEKPRDFVGFVPDEASRSIDSFEKICNPLIERAIFDGKEGETNAEQNREDNERPLDNKNKITSKK